MSASGLLLLAGVPWSLLGDVLLFDMLAIAVAGLPCASTQHASWAILVVVVAGGILFYSRSFFLHFFLSSKDLRDGSTNREPF